MAEKVKIQKARLRQNGASTPTETVVAGSAEWGSPPQSPVADIEKDQNTTLNGSHEEANSSTDTEKSDKGKQKEKEGTSVKRFRGVPEDVKLFEVFWKQVVELIKVRDDCSLIADETQVSFHQARPDLSIQDITALLVSLTNLSVSCYPDRLEYVDQVLGFAHDKVKEFSDR